MRSRLAALAASESIVLERMAVSRANLVAARQAARARSGSDGASLTVRARELVSTAPNVTLLAALLVGSLVIGPRRIVSVVVRNGLVAWIGKTVRRIAGK